MNQFVTNSRISLFRRYEAQKLTKVKILTHCLCSQQNDFFQMDVIQSKSNSHPWWFNVSASKKYQVTFTANLCNSYQLSNIRVPFYSFLNNVKCLHFIHVNTFSTCVSPGTSMFLSAVNMSVKYESIFYRALYCMGINYIFCALRGCRSFYTFVKRHFRILFVQH